MRGARKVARDASAMGFPKAKKPLLPAKQPRSDGLTPSQRLFQRCDALRDELFAENLQWPK